MRTGNIYIIMLSPLLLFSCSGIVERMHKQIDEDQRKNLSYSRTRNDHFDLYRNPQVAYKRDKLIPTRGGNNRASTRYTPNNPPGKRRLYRPAQKKRIKADDLVDDGNTGSLWAGRDQDSNLFTKDSEKSIGDIVLIQVQSRLKNEITLELSRAVPSPKPQKKKTEGPQPPGAPGQQNQEPQQVSEEGVNEEKIYDRISSVVVEEISKDHVLLRGKKDVLFRKRKHLVEVQALVARKDITDTDSVASSKILESSITVLR